MENQLQLNNQFLMKNHRRYQRLRLLLYSEDFDFAQSFTLYFRKDYHKIITVNDKETLLQIVPTIKPEVIVLDSVITESFLELVSSIKSNCPTTKIFVFTSHAISQQNLAKRLGKLVDRIFYQPIDLSEFNQFLNFYTAD